MIPHALLRAVFPGCLLDNAIYGKPKRMIAAFCHDRFDAEHLDRSFPAAG
jgi:hypothetical protein